MSKKSTRNSNWRKVLLICASVILLAYIFTPFSIYQEKIVGVEVDSPCTNIVGLRYVRYVTPTVSTFESLAHYGGYCFFSVPIK